MDTGMKDRLVEFLSAENISQSQFADSIGVARASISHIVSGRNKPGYDFIESTVQHYPALNIDWLISGNGKMYKDSQPINNSLFDNTLEQATSTIDTSQVKKVSPVSERRRISKIVVFYDDNTFEEVI